MAEIKPSTTDQARDLAHVGLDRDVAVGRIIAVGVGLAALVVVAAFVCVFLYGRYRDRLAQADPPPSPVPEANEAPVPPEPRLQPDPDLDMAALRAREAGVLKSYGWVDKDAGIARIPIERAIDLTLSSGLRAARTEPPHDDSTPDGGAQ